MSAEQSRDTMTVVTTQNMIENTEPEQVALVETSESNQDADQNQNPFFDIRLGHGVAFNTFILDIAGFTGATAIALDGLGEDGEIEITIVEAPATGQELATSDTAPRGSRPRN